MFEELVRYWKDSNNHTHPNDSCLIEANERETDENYKLHTDLYAEPYMGSLSKPKIVFLYLNPGYHEADDDIQKDNKIGNTLINVLRQSLNDTEYPFLWLDADYKDTPKVKNPGAFYWNRLIDQKTGTSFLKCLAEAKWNADETETARKRIANNVCDIELFPYHSIKFDKKWLNTCSVRMAREAVIKAIYENTDTLFVFMRSFSLWIPEENDRLPISQRENVVINKAVRNPSLNPNLKPKNGETCIGRRILDFLLS